MRRGSAPAPAIYMENRWKKLLEKEKNKHSCSVKNYTRISILLLASEGLGNKTIAKQLNINYQAVKKWRSRWNSSYTKIQVFEKGKEGKGVSDYELIKKLLEVIQDSPRSGAPSRISKSSKEQIVAIACKKPEDYGIIETDWTLKTLAAVAIKKQIVKTISPSHVWNLLKNEDTSTQ